MFNGFYGDMDTVLVNMTAESVFTKVKDAAGIHFSTFSDPKKAGKTEEAVDAEEEAIAAGAKTVRSNHRPDAQWKARNFAPHDPNAKRGIKMILPNGERVEMD